MAYKSPHLQFLIDSGWNPSASDHQALSISKRGWRLSVLEVYCKNCGADPFESCDQSVPDIGNIPDCILINGSHMDRFIEAIDRNRPIELDLFAESMRCGAPCDLRGANDTGFCFYCEDCDAVEGQTCEPICLPGDKSLHRRIRGIDYYLMHPSRIERGELEDEINGWDG